MPAIAIAIVTVACLAANLLSDLFIAPTDKVTAHGWDVVGAIGLYGGGAMLLLMGLYTLRDYPALVEDNAPQTQPGRRSALGPASDDIYTSSNASS